MRSILALALALGLLLAGCTGGGGGASDPLDTTPTTSDTSPSPTNNSQEEEEFVPKFHYHDYWRERDKVQLFDSSKAIMIGQDPYNEFYTFNQDVVIGSVTFDPETDGDDGEASQRSDVVYQGTERVEIKVTWTDTQNIPGLSFHFSPANTPDFLRLGPVKSGQTYTIEMKENWADMPHQLDVSRWAFRLDAYDERFENYPVRVHRASGEVHVEMWIINGGEKFIDPPHPYFFKEGPSRSAGEIKKNFVDCIVVNSSKVDKYYVPPTAVGFQCGHAQGPIDLMPPAPYIVPWETTTLVIELHYNLSSKASVIPHKVGLMFHGADSLKYRYPQPKTSTSNYVRYEVAVTERMSDTPYADETDWRYGLYPIINDQKDLGGDITGNFNIVLTAVKAGDTSDRGNR